MSQTWPALAGDPQGEAATAIPAIAWGDIVRLWLRTWWILVPTAVVGGVASLALSFLMTPIYEAGAVIMLDRADPGHLGNAADRPVTDAQEKASVVTSQVAILRSTAVVSRVIEQLGLVREPMFNPQPGLASRLLASLPRGLVTASTPAAGSASPQDRLISGFLSRLTITQEPGSYVMTVSFRAPDPVLAARIANAEVENYLGWSRDQQTHAISGAQSWLAQAMDAARQRMIAADRAVEDMNRQGVVLTAEGHSALDQGLTQLTTDLAAAQAQAVQAQARADEIRRLQAAGQEAGIAAMSGSQVLQNLETAAAQTQASSAGVDSGLGARHPLAMQAGARSSETRAAIAQGIEHFVSGVTSQATVARATVTNLMFALEKMKQQVVAAEGDRAKLRRLQGVADAERTSYLGLLVKLRSYDEVDQLAAPDVTVLSTAITPSVPYAPRRALLAVVGFLLAGGLAAAAVAWFGSRREVVRHSTDAESLTGLRYLGLMPQLPGRKRGAPDRNGLVHSFFREELRSICAALVQDRQAVASEGVTVMVTSCLPGEGKSTFCRELGLFAAQNGVRTLIVRADRMSAERLPAAARKERRSDEHVPLVELDWTVPATTMGDQRPSRQLEEWRREFTLVILDTPPLSAMAESLVLAPFAESTIVLVRADSTPRSLLAGVTERIGNAGGRLAGFVITFAQLSRQRGTVPSDPGYYFRQNRSYHRHLIAARAHGQR